MQQLINLIEELKKSYVKPIIDLRIKEFESFQNKSSNEIFKELCFCLLTANFSAKGGIKIQNAVNDGFLNLSEEELSKKLSELGHRFPNVRANYILLARIYKDNIKEILLKLNNETLMREWVVKNIKGIGMKEASHFLRNIGYKSLSIVDFHIVDLLVKHGLIETPKFRSLTPKKYLEVENLLKEIATRSNLSLGELDLYLWYKETGTILK